ncbi:hypothetical protein Cal7507_0698 [Calothrix sp. PCC 7507]|nr:hypothetical protein Cal7507_0698 [Calothrix sp. PCC 7507]
MNIGLMNISKTKIGIKTNDLIYVGLTHNTTTVGVINELPLRKNQVFGHILRKS